MGVEVCKRRDLSFFLFKIEHVFVSRRVRGGIDFILDEFRIIKHFFIYESSLIRLLKNSASTASALNFFLLRLQSKLS